MSRSLLLCFLLLCSLDCCELSFAQSVQPDTPILDLTIATFKADGSMLDVLRTLKRADPNRMVIGFEMAASGTDPMIHIALESGTVSEILAQAVALDPRYEYREISKTTVNIFPKAPFRDPKAILDIVAPTLAIDRQTSVENLIRGIPSESPAFRDGLLKAGVPVSAPGGAGSCFKGNFDPIVKLQLSNVTLRDALNALLSESVKFSKASGTDPVGWVFNPHGLVDRVSLDQPPMFNILE